jgi:hypothetical protein
MNVTDVTPESDYYARMLPPRERPVEALGGMLNAVGVALAIGCLFIWPIFLGVPAMLFSGMSLAMSRSRATAQRFAYGFTITVVLWVIGLMMSVYWTSALWP